VDGAGDGVHGSSASDAHTHQLFSPASCRQQELVDSPSDLLHGSRETPFRLRREDQPPFDATRFTHQTHRDRGAPDIDADGRRFAHRQRP
jgi:hypothetical protein